MLERAACSPLQAGRSERESSPVVSIRKVALPVEHGGWGILLEPLVLAMIVAPSWSGLLIALASIGAFLARQPLKIALSDRLRGKVYPRTRLAIRVAVYYAAGAAVLTGLALFNGLVAAAIPLGLAFPAAMLLLWFDARNRSRDVVAELSGAVAMGSLAASLALAGGARPLVAYALWLLMLTRSVPAILFVRARLRMDRGRQARGWLVIAAHSLGLAIAAAVGARMGAPILTTVALAVLLARSIFGLYGSREALTPRQIGWREIAFGCMTIILVGTGLVAGI